MKSSKDTGVGIAGTMDQDVPVGMFKCRYCGTLHETPAVAKALCMHVRGGPGLAFWCSKDCWSNDDGW